MLLFISSSMTGSISDRIDGNLRSKGVLEKTRDKLLEIQAFGNRLISGPKIHPEVRRLISQDGHHSYVMLRINEGKRRGIEKYLRRFAKHTRDLGKRFFDNDQTVYSDIPNVELFPWLEEGRYFIRNELHLPVIAKRTIPKDTLQLNRGLASWHMDLLQDIDHPNPLDLELIDGVDPYFEIEVIRDKQDTLRGDLTIGINTYRLRQLLRKSPEVKMDMVDRHYPTVSEGKLVTIAYILSGIPGREKEIPAIEYSSL